MALEVDRGGRGDAQVGVRGPVRVAHQVRRDDAEDLEDVGGAAGVAADAGHDRLAGDVAEGVVHELERVVYALGERIAGYVVDRRDHGHGGRAHAGNRHAGDRRHRERLLADRSVDEEAVGRLVPVVGEHPRRRRDSVADADLVAAAGGLVVGAEGKRPRAIRAEQTVGRRLRSRLGAVKVVCLGRAVEGNSQIDPGLAF